MYAIDYCCTLLASIDYCTFHHALVSTGVVKRLQNERIGRDWKRLEGHGRAKDWLQDAETIFRAFFTPHLHAPTGSTDGTSRRAELCSESVQDQKSSKNGMLRDWDQILAWRCPDKPVTHVLLTNIQ